MQKNIDQESRL